MNSSSRGAEHKISKDGVWVKFITYIRDDLEQNFSVLDQLDEQAMKNPAFDKWVIAVTIGNLANKIERIREEQIKKYLKEGSEAWIFYQDWVPTFRKQILAIQKRKLEINKILGERPSSEIS